MNELLKKLQIEEKLECRIPVKFTTELKDRAKKFADTKEIDLSVLVRSIMIDFIIKQPQIEFEVPKIEGPITTVVRFTPKIERFINKKSLELKLSQSEYIYNIVKYYFHQM